MVDSSENHRAKVKAALLAKADELFANFDSYPTVLDEPEKNYIAKQAFSDNGNAMTLVKWRCQGLTMEHLQPWIDDPTATQIVLNNRMERHALPDDDGHKMWHLKINMPMILSNRSVITCFYREKTADGFDAIFHSSQGNEAQTEANAAAIGSDVIAINEITYTAWKPLEDGSGFELKQVMCFDPAGMIPGMIKNAMAGRMANGLQLMIDYLQNGTVPPPAF